MKSCDPLFNWKRVRDLHSWTKCVPAMTLFVGKWNPACRVLIKQALFLECRPGNFGRKCSHWSAAFLSSGNASVPFKLIRSWDPEVWAKSIEL